MNPDTLPGPTQSLNESTQDITQESGYHSGVFSEVQARVCMQIAYQEGFTMVNHAPVGNPALYPVSQPQTTQTVSADTNPFAQMQAPARGRDALHHSAAFEQARTNAAHGSISAILELGGFYYHGEGGVSQDFSLAMNWFQRAADQGSAEAQFNIATMHRQGHGVIHNPTTALEWYQKAAEQGYVDAQCSIGLLYFNGEGVQQDYSSAIAWFLKSAGQGNCSAGVAIANMFQFGVGVLKDEEKAQEWHLMAVTGKVEALQAP